MDAFAPNISKEYTDYAALLLRHHRLLVDGRVDADETAAVEERMTQLWEGLDATQRKSLAGLGSDLNWVRRGALAPLAPRPQDVSQADLGELARAKEAGEWHKVLHQLRVCTPKVPPAQSAQCRAEAWKAIGQPLIARVFSEYASKLEPSRAGS